MIENHTCFPFLLCQIEPPQSANGGDYHYRTHAPGLAMAREKGVFVVNLTNEHRRKWNFATQADVLVLKNICDPDFLPLIRQRKEQGKVTIYEIADDLGAIEPWNPVFFFYKEKENQSMVWRLASYCDALQVTCATLKDLYGHLNPICRVFRNHISHVPLERSGRKNGGLVVGWGGSHGHLQDVAEIAEPLSEWIKQGQNVSLSLMSSEPIRQLFSNIPADKKRFFPTGSIEDYYHFLRNLDIGIGPIKDTPFNRSRSDVKFLEYAVSEVVPVMRNLAPYADTIQPGETGLLYTEPRELIEHLARLTTEPNLISRIGKNARNYVLMNRLEADHARERVAFYRDLLVKSGGMNPSRNPGEWAWLAAMDGAVVTGRHIRLEPTKFELLLHDGLVAMQVMKEREMAFRLFRRASAVQPGNYLPFLYGASVSPDPVETLLQAVKLNPTSLKARIMLGDFLAERGSAIEALRCYSDAAEIFSDYEIPLLRAASLLKRVGEPEKADRLSEKAASLFVHGPALPSFSCDRRIELLH